MAVLEPCGFSPILLLIGRMCSKRALLHRRRCCVAGLRHRSSQIWWQIFAACSPPSHKVSHQLSIILISFCRYGAAGDWQVQVAAHCPGHRRRGGGRLGGAAVFRQLRYVWKLFSGGFILLLLGFPPCSTSILPPLMKKQDLFRLEKGKRGAEGGAGISAALLSVCVCEQWRNTWSNWNIDSMSKAVMEAEAMELWWHLLMPSALNRAKRQEAAGACCVWTPIVVFRTRLSVY